MTLRPFCLPASCGEGQRTSKLQPFVGLAVYFRTSYPPQRPPGWRGVLLRAPITSDELKQLPREQYEKDEMNVPRQLAQVSTLSASIASSLKISMEAVREAMKNLQHDRESQTDLAAVLGRHEVEGVYPEWGVLHLVPRTPLL